MPLLDKTGLIQLWTNILNVVNTKVDKMDGKGLSTHDFTNEYKDKLEAIDVHYTPVQIITWEDDD